MQCVGRLAGTSKLARSPQMTSLPIGCPAWTGGGAGGSPRPRACRWPGGWSCPETMEPAAIITSAASDRADTHLSRIFMATAILPNLARLFQAREEVESDRDGP